MSLTLAGHGGDALDFSKASMARWRQQVEDGIDTLAARCDTVIAVGHSMGCLLALEQAERERVDGLLLLNPPLRIRIRWRALTNVVKIGLGIGRNDVRVLSALDAYGVSIDYNPWHYRGWPMRYIELFRESRKIRHMVESHSLNCAMGVVVSGDDEMVAPESLLCFSRQPKCRVVCLPHSGHYYYSQSDKEVIAGIFTDLTGGF